MAEKVRLVFSDLAKIVMVLVLCICPLVAPAQSVTATPKVEAKVTATDTLKVLNLVGGSVLQVLNNGLLLSDVDRYIFKKGADGNFIRPEEWKSSIFLECNPTKSNIVDGDNISELVVRDGVFKYTNSLGQVKTVEKYKLVSPEFKKWYFRNFPLKTKP